MEYAARQLGVNGWVRNVGYDVVEAVAEGERAKLERLAEAVRTGPRGSHVDESTVEWLDRNRRVRVLCRPTQHLRPARALARYENPSPRSFIETCRPRPMTM